jgi:hypothetical protein
MYLNTAAAPNNTRRGRSDLNVKPNACAHERKER